MIFNSVLIIFNSQIHGIHTPELKNRKIYYTLKCLKCHLGNHTKYLIGYSIII